MYVSLVTDCIPFENHFKYKTPLLFYITSKKIHKGPIFLTIQSSSWSKTTTKKFSSHRYLFFFFFDCPLTEISIHLKQIRKRLLMGFKVLIFCLVSIYFWKSNILQLKRRLEELSWTFFKVNKSHRRKIMYSPIQKL